MQSGFLRRAAATLSAGAATTSKSSQAATMSTEPHIVVGTAAEWKRAIEELPTLERTGDKIPSIFLAHGQPMLIWPTSIPRPGVAGLTEVQGPNGLLVQFLRDLGPALVAKYSPKAVVVLSAHWETDGETLVSDYGDQNPLLYDYYGFPDELYNVKFKSRGDHALSERIVDLLKKANLPSRLLGQMEGRGEDGRGFVGRGLDHGVFVPFKHMFGDDCALPIVQVSIDGSLRPEDEWKLGQALEPLRSEGVLVISGGLTIHNLRDRAAFGASTCPEPIKQFEEALVDAVRTSDTASRKKALTSLIHHPGFRGAHPREEHFVPIYVAAGASDASQGGAKILSGFHGAKTVAFGV